MSKNIERESVTKMFHDIIGPLEEDEYQLTPLHLMLILGRGQFDIATQTVQLDDEPKPVPLSFEKHGASVCLKAREVFVSRHSYLTSNYPTRNLTKCAFDAFNISCASSGIVVLKNDCCTVTDCPHILFMKIVVDLMTNVVTDI